MRTASLLRAAAVLVIMCATLFAFGGFLRYDWPRAWAVWQGRGYQILLAFLFNAAGLGFDFIGWRITYARFGVPLSWRRAFLYYTSIFFALLLPAQTGRLFRIEAVHQDTQAPRRQLLKAETFLFYIDLLVILSSVGFFFAIMTIPLLAPFVLLGGIAAGLGAPALAAPLFARKGVRLPVNIWRQPQTFAVLGLKLIDWNLYGLTLYTLLWSLPGNALGYAHAQFFALASTIVGAGSGIPGGLGALEGSLSLFLNYMRLPEQDTLIVVGLFRGITLWAPVPLGWAVMYYLRFRRKET